MAHYITDASGKLMKVSGNGYSNLDCLRTKILWTNPNPSSSFETQTITLSSDDYDYLVLIPTHNIANQIKAPACIMSKGTGGRIVSADASSNSTYIPMVMARDVTRVSDTQFTISSCRYNYGSTYTETRNDLLVPYQIIGLYKQPAMIYTGKELFNDPVTAGVTRTGQHDTVSEYYMSSDGNTWYRKWASGWKECGGKIAKGLSGQHKVTFPLTFSNTNFTILKTLNWQSSEAVINRAYFGFQDITTNSAYTYSYTADGYDESWYACGF